MTHGNPGARPTAGLRPPVALELPESAKTPQEQLTDLLKTEGDRTSSINYYRHRWQGIADHAIAVGWRPPARILISIEELDTIQPDPENDPKPVIIRDADGVVYERDLLNEEITSEHVYWFIPGVDSDDIDSTRIKLPATVLWHPAD